GDNPVTIAMKHVEEEPMPPSTYRQNIPPMLEAVVMRAMNKNPDVRPTSAEMVQELSVVEKTFGMTKTTDPDATQVLPRADAEIPSRRAARRKQTAEPAKKSFFQSKMFFVGLMAFLLMGFGLGSFLAFGNFFNQEEVTVPDVTGKQLALARQLLEDGKLRVNVAETYDGTVPPGQVVSQDPESGKTVRSARLVTIYVSKGGEEIEMPDLKGLTKSAATEVITKAGLNLDSIYEKYSEEEPGTVLSQDPAVGTKINRGSLIDITVSRGESASPTHEETVEEPVKVTKSSVPDLRGASLDVARGGLEARGLTVGIVSYQVSGQAEGTVISQTPSSGTELYSGEAVDLVIAEREPSSSYNESSYAEPSREERTNEEPSDERMEPVYYDEPATRSFEPESYDAEPNDQVMYDAPSRDSNASKSR
ncbi:MAG: PASTA domain-containing protein, partial [Selenomonadaceae bacterium]|nr:PASTA domain-containing protein [Selenomonadaceae bacterium]